MEYHPQESLTMTENEVNLKDLFKMISFDNNGSEFFAIISNETNRYMMDWYRDSICLRWLILEQDTFTTVALGSTNVTTAIIYKIISQTSNLSNEHVIITDNYYSTLELAAILDRTDGL
eukprot:NODE_589_length_5652_cov_0.848730.p7 type:complete len:119 gc:universal NODE_589_length_5652_cov_0.848730:350-706(+)